MNLTGHETTSINIERKKIKNLYLHVRVPNVVHVSAPMRISLSDIYAFVESKSMWIKKGYVAKKVYIWYAFTKF